MTFPLLVHRQLASQYISAACLPQCSVWANFDLYSTVYWTTFVKNSPTIPKTPLIWMSTYLRNDLSNQRLHEMGEIKVWRSVWREGEKFRSFPEKAPGWKWWRWASNPRTCEQSDPNIRRASVRSERCYSQSSSSSPILGIILRFWDDGEEILQQQISRNIELHLSIVNLNKWSMQPSIVWPTDWLTYLQGIYVSVERIHEDKRNRRAICAVQVLQECSTTWRKSECHWLMTRKTRSGSKTIIQ